MSTHVEFMVKKFSSTLQSVNFQFQCVYAPLDMTIKIYMIHGTCRGDVFLYGEYLYTFTKVFVSPHELQL